MVVLLNWIKVLLLIAGLASAGLAYGLWQKNSDLKADVKSLTEAREKDAKAATDYVNELLAEQADLQERLKQLEGIDDEAGREFLGTPVPNSVRRLFR